LVPVYILVGQFTAKEAVPLSNITILGGSIANCVFNFLKQHPYHDKPPDDYIKNNKQYLFPDDLGNNCKIIRPRIDFDIVNVMEPMTIAGAVLGSLINKLLPGWLLTVLLMIILGMLTVKTGFSGKNKWNKENEEFSFNENIVKWFENECKTGRYAGIYTEDYAQLDDDKTASVREQYRAVLKEDANVAKAQEEAEKKGLLNVESGTPHYNAVEPNEESLKEAQKWWDIEGVDIRGMKEYTGRDDQTGELSFAEETEEYKTRKADNERLIRQYLQAESYSFPPFKLALLVFVWVGVNVLDLLRGGGSFHGPFDIYCGDAGYWVFTFLYIPFTVAVASYVACYLMYDTKKKTAIEYPWLKGDVKWNQRRSIAYPLICSTAGIFAGMFGVGGGIVKGPLMNEMGVLPEVTQATAAFMIFFTASSATVSFALYGMILWDYAAVLFVVGLIFTAIGQVVVFWLVEKLGRSSIIIVVIAAILGTSTVMLAVNGFSAFADQLSCNCDQKYAVCGS